MSEINLFLTVTFLDFLYTSFTQIKECSWHHWINGKSWWVLCSFHASGVQISSYCWSFFLLIFEKSDFYWMTRHSLMSWHLTLTEPETVGGSQSRSWPSYHFYFTFWNISEFKEKMRLVRTTQNNPMNVHVQLPTTNFLTNTTNNFCQFH